MTERTLFRAPVARGVASSETPAVDRNGRVIRGYAVVTKGLVPDRNWEMDDTSLEGVVKLGNGLKMGLKSRLGHPNMSEEAFGRFLGRARNFRRDGDIVRADLLFDPTAFSTPEGDLAGYVMSRAETDPASFGSSLVAQVTVEARLNEDGTPAKDKAGKPLPKLVRFRRLWGSDVVDEPAANEGFFDSTNVVLSDEATRVLDRLLQQEDGLERIFHFLSRFAESRKGGTAMDYSDEPEAPQAQNDDVGALFQKLAGFFKRRKPPLDEGDQDDVRSLQMAAVERDREALRRDRAELAVERDLAPYRERIEPAHLGKLEPLLLKLKTAELAGDEAAATQYGDLRDLVPKLASPLAGSALAGDDTAALKAELGETTESRKTVEVRLGPERMAELRRKYPALRAAAN